MTFRKWFDLFWDRLSRSTPVIGLGASALSRPSRLQAAAGEDAAYRTIMTSLGANPELGQDSQNLCRNVMRGEIVGHLIALGLGLPLFFLLHSLREAFFVTWAIAFVADWSGGKIGAALHSRAVAPVVDETMRDSPYGNEEGEPPVRDDGETVPQP